MQLPWLPFIRKLSRYLKLINFCYGMSTFTELSVWDLNLCTRSSWYLALRPYCCSRAMIKSITFCTFIYVRIKNALYAFDVRPSVRLSACSFSLSVETDLNQIWRIVSCDLSFIFILKYPFLLHYKYYCFLSPRAQGFNSCLSNFLPISSFFLQGHSPLENPAIYFPAISDYCPVWIRQ